MGWNLNRAMGMTSNILGNRLETFQFTPDSFSSIKILIKDKITVEEEDQIAGLFPEWIRVQFESKDKEE